MSGALLELFRHKTWATLRQPNGLDVWGYAEATGQGAGRLRHLETFRENTWTAS
jgi:hypothetical protein